MSQLGTSMSGQALRAATISAPDYEPSQISEQDGSQEQNSELEAVSEQQLSGDELLEHFVPVSSSVSAEGDLDRNQRRQRQH